MVSGFALVMYFSTVNAVAQSKGQTQGRSPVVATGQNRVASSDHGPAKTTDHGSVKTESKDHTGDRADHEGVRPSKDQEIVAHIDHNPELNARIVKLLPTGMDLTTAAMGFKNQGQFIAALHVSKNLNIPFDQLKAKMTGADPVSLGKAIQQLRPTMPEKEIEIEKEKAEQQAKATQKTTTKQTSD